MRSEAQKRADKKYRETHEQNCTLWGTYLKKTEIPDLNETIKNANMSKADFIRWAKQKLKNQ